MRRLSLALVVILAAGTLSAHAEVRSFNKLSLNEKMALEESERRMVLYDQELQQLDQARKRKKISAENYRNETEQLTIIIREESLYQNAIMVQDPQLPQRAQDLLETLEHAAIAVPEGIGYVVARCPQLLELFALIH